MNSKQNYFMNKAFLWSVGIIVVIILSGLFFLNNMNKQASGNDSTAVLEGQKVTYLSNNGNKKLSLDKNSKFETYKKVARLEGQKAGVNKNTMNEIIDNAEVPEDLVDQTYSASSNASSDPASVSLLNYAEHMKNTEIYVNKNGNKAHVYVKDSSPDSYINTASKVYNISEL